MNHPESISLVVIYKVFDILKEKGPWPVMSDYPSHVKEQGSLCLTGKAMFSAKSIFL